MQPNGRRALIVVDYQNDFVTGSMGFAKALTLERPIVEKIDAAKQQGIGILLFWLHLKFHLQHLLVDPQVP